MVNVVCQVNKEVANNLGLELDNLADKGRRYKPLIGNVDCKLDTVTNEVYIPFSHINSYFEVRLTRSPYYLV